MLTTMASASGTALPGQVIAVDDATGESLIKAGCAVEVPVEAPKVTPPDPADRIAGLEARAMNAEARLAAVEQRLVEIGQAHDKLVAALAAPVAKSKARAAATDAG